MSTAVDQVVWARALGASTAPELAEQIGNMCLRTSDEWELVEAVGSAALSVPDDTSTEGLANAARLSESAKTELQAAHRTVLS